MALTQLSDVLIPQIWIPYALNATTTKSELVTSGIVQSDPVFDALANGAGQTANMPYWNDLTGTSQVISDSTPLVPQKIGTTKDIAVIQERGNPWEHNDLVSMLAGSDPARAVAEFVGAFWARDMQTTLLSQLKGVFGAASMSALILAIHQTSGAPGVANYLTGATFVDACQKLGDAKSLLTAVAMHSAVEAALIKLDLIDYVPDSEGKAMLKMFQGKRVIVDDGMPVETINGANVFTTYLFGQGAIALGNGSEAAMTAVQGGFGTWGLEFYRTALGGNSGMINRKKMILHPRGVKWTGNTMAGPSPTNAEFETSANWERVFDVKKMRVVKVTHNIAE
jgi:hypothetical protein